jgi:PAS domain S-box-containing protein
MPEDIPKSYLDLLYKISRELSTSLNLNTVLARLLFLSTQNVGAERGSLIALNELQRPITAALVHDGEILPYSLSEIQTILDKGLAGWVLENLKPVLIQDTSMDHRWLKRPDDDVSQTGSKSAICIPIILGGEQLVGVLTIVHPTPNFFIEEHLNLLQAIADQASIAIYNAMLYENLQVAQQRYQELFEESIDPIFVTDWKGSILEANRKASLATGYEASEICHHSIYEMHDADLNILLDHSAALHTMETIQYESMINARSGKRIPVEVFIRIVIIEGGEYLQWLMHDITERKMLDSLRDELAAMIYHDLRSPLSNVISGIDMMKSVLTEQELSNFSPYLNIIDRSVLRVQRLTNSLLDINRLESGHNLIQGSNVQVEALIKASIEEVQPILKSKQIKLKTEISHDLPEIIVDEDMIHRVLINLLDNAVKFTPVHGSISVGARIDNLIIDFWVEDNGPGIPADELETIFNKFARLQPQSGPKGVGLGLAYCRLAVQAHGGQIKAQNVPGKGSRFSFSLPAN